MWSPADICEQWERNLSFGSADVRGAGTSDKPLRTSAWRLYVKSNKVCLNPHNTGTRTNGSVECFLITQYTIQFTFRFCSSCLSLNAVYFAFFLATVQARRGRWLWWYRHVRTSLIALITTLVLLYNPRKCNQIHTPMFQRERAFVPQPSSLVFVSFNVLKILTAQ